MTESSGFIRKAVGFDQLEAALTEQKTVFLSKFDDLDRQIKHLAEALAYANHQLLEVREKLETAENVAAQAPSHHHRAPSAPKMNEVEGKVLEVVKKSGTISASEASLLSGLSRTRASEILNELVRKSIISKEKKGKVSFFVFSSDVSMEPEGGRKDTA
jgi:uncharacterized membrane protein